MTRTSDLWYSGKTHSLGQSQGKGIKKHAIPSPFPLPKKKYAPKQESYDKPQLQIFDNKRMKKMDFLLV